MSDWQDEQWERERAEVRRRLSGDLTPLERDLREAAAEPLSAVLAPLVAHAEKVRLRMAPTVCEGLVAHVGRCGAWDRARCKENEAPECPRRIVAYEAAKARAVGKCMTTGELFEGMGIPPAIARALAEDVLDENDSRQIAGQWWATTPRPRVLLLNGESQIGKTFAAAELCAKWSGRFVHVPTVLAARARDAGFTGSLRTPSLLVLDDLGMERLDGFDDFKAAFDALFCARVDAGMFTVITTNCGSEIRRRYGDRVAERIAKHGWSKNIARAA